MSARGYFGGVGWYGKGVILIVGRATSWAGDSGMYEMGNWAEHIQGLIPLCFLVAEMVWAAAPTSAALISLLHGAVSQAKTNPPSLSLFLSEYHSSGKRS